jgi:putative endonuclease
MVGPPTRGKNRKIYTGYTQHLSNRITQHSGLNSVKGARLTRKQPIELVYLEQFSSRKQALQREWEFKHKTPYNQKEFKLSLIREFQQSYSDLLNEINEQLSNHYDFLQSIITTFNLFEKEMASRIEKKKK